MTKPTPIGTISSMGDIADALAERFEQEVNDLIADAIDQPVGGKPISLADRLLRFQEIATDPMEAEALLDSETEAEGLNAYDPADPEAWQVPKSVIVYLRARARELKKAGERD